MIVDGKAMAADVFAALKNEISHRSHAPHVTVITCAPEFATQKYLGLKQAKAKAIGMGVTLIELPREAATEDVVAVIARASMQTDGIIVQLPLPEHIDTEVVMAAIPAHLDVDGMHYTASGEGFLPPVIGAIAEIVERHDVLLAAQSVVIVGQGRLVGVPAAVWARNQGAQVSVLTKESPDQPAVISGANILILGAGVPGLILPDMIKPGAIIFDAGTSEEGGELRGDADPACAEKASLFTPVPGGVGPLTVAALLRNVVLAAS